MQYPLGLWLSTSNDSTEVLFGLFIMFASAKLMAEIFERLKQPAVVGEIVAGILIGPSVLKLVSPTEITTFLAEIGVIFLLFTVGLETRPSDLFRVGKTATLVAVLGVMVPFVLGYGLVELTGAKLMGSHTRTESIFIGAAMVATSVGITARVLGDMGLINAQTSRVILGAAVIDDVLGLLILAIVSGLAKGNINYVELATTAGLAIGFTVFLIVIGSRLVNRLAPRVEQLRVKQSYYVFALILCLGISDAAAYIGVAAIVGAFLAGVMLAERAHQTNLVQQSEALMEFLVPFFLVNIGMQLRLDAFLNAGVLMMAMLVTVLAFIGKLVGCGVGAIGLGWRRATQVGIGMVPRGEVGIVVAQIGLGLGTISHAMYGVVLFMAVVTTLLAPPLLRLSFRGEAIVPKEGPYREQPVGIE